MKSDSSRFPDDKQITADLHALGKTSRVDLGSPAALGDLIASRASTNPNHSNTQKGYSNMSGISRTRRFRIGMAVVATVLAATGIVFAATQTSLFSIWVDTSGKSEHEVEDEVRGQLVDQGIENPEVEFDRQESGTKLDIQGNQNGKEIRLIHRTDGETSSPVIHMEPPALDTEREPGMTDAQLEAKIRAQIEALGLTGDVAVHDDDVEVRIRQHAPVHE